ncbi:MAG TPA: sugar transferase [Gaiellaceae bacterium]
MSAAAEPVGFLRDLVDDRTREILTRRRAVRAARGRRGWIVRRLLVAADLLGLAGAMFVAELAGAARPADAAAEMLKLVATLPAWIVVANIYGLYDRDEERTDHSTADDLVGVFHLVTVCTWLLWAAAHTVGLVHPTSEKLLIFWGSAVALVSLGRVGARAVAHRSAAYVQNAVIVGSGEVGQLVARKFLSHQEYGINVVGFVDNAAREDDALSLPMLGRIAQLPEIARQLDVERVIFAFSGTPYGIELDLIRELERQRVQIDIVPRLFEIVTPTSELHQVEGVAVLSLRPVRMTTASRVMKRGLDVAVSSVALLLLTPVFAVIAWLIRRDSEGPVFFRQTRIGMDMREFTFLKFRTMRQGTSAADHEAYVRESMKGDGAPERDGLYKLERSDAVTRVGRFLRRTSLDELPQLLNVLRGDMSLVGPRPCLPYEAEMFLPHHYERFAVPAGITGLWQVMARAHATFREALDMDVAYARGWSFGLDLRLLLRTPLQLVRTRGTR